MKWTVPQIQILKNQGGKIDEIVDLSAIRALDPQIIAISPIQVTGQMEIEPSQIIFQLRIRGELTLPCARTLLEVPFPVDVKTTERFFLKQPSAEEASMGTLVQNDRIDLLPVLQEILLLEIPMQVFADHADQTSGAPRVGDHWELITGESTETTIDPRLAKLTDLFNEEE